MGSWICCACRTHCSPSSREARSMDVVRFAPEPVPTLTKMRVSDDLMALTSLNVAEQRRTLDTCSLK